MKEEGEWEKAEMVARGPRPVIAKPLLSNLKSQIANPPSTFRLLVDRPASGPWNMAVDEALLESAESDGQCTIRFYQWQEPTLSLGYFQTYADRWQHDASRKAAVVRRSSGGGAILHDLELTYSVAVPSHHPLAVDRLGFYQAMHRTLIEALKPWAIVAKMYDEKAKKADRTPTHDPRTTINNPSHLPPVPPPPSDAPPFLCFQRRAPGDVLVGNVKIAGSAQRRSRGAVLQHGSVLLARSSAAPELIGLAELVDKKIEPQSLIDAWLAELKALLGIHWQTGGLSASQMHRAAVLEVGKYASPTWTENRGRFGNL